MILLFYILFARNLSKIRFNEDASIEPQMPTQTPLPTLTPIPTESPTPFPSQTPTKSFEIIIMNPLQSNAVGHTLSVIAIVSLAIICTISTIYVIFYIIPFVREDISPLL